MQRLFLFEVKATGSKTKTTQTQDYKYYQPPPTTATTNLQSMVDTPVDYATPIRSSYARAKTASDRSFDNPLGAYTTADVKDKSQRSANYNLAQSEAYDLGNAAQQTSQDKFNRQAVVGQMTSPQLMNSGGTSVTQTPFNWGSLISAGVGGGASLGSAAMM